MHLNTTITTYDESTINPNGEEYIIVHPTGTKTITENGTGIDVAEYAKVDVNVSVEPTPPANTVGTAVVGTATVGGA